jgi:hypothetical protein
MRGQITGGCLCGEIRYEVVEPAVWSHNCHCSRCRRATGTAFASTLFVPEGAFSYTTGEELLGRFEVPEAETFNHVFCTRCGSTLPFHPLIPGLIGVPMGTIDGDPHESPRAHIFVESKAPWFDITDSLPQNAKGFEKPQP